MRRTNVGWKAAVAIWLVAFVLPPYIAAGQAHSSRLEQLFSSDAAVRGAAKQDLLKHPDPTLLPDLLGALPKATGTIRDDFFEILAQYNDPRKIPAFLALVKPFHWDSEKNVILQQLTRLGTPAEEALLAGCKGEGEEYATWAAGGFLFEQGVPYLLRAVQSDDECQHQLGQTGLNDMFGEADPESEIRFDIGLAADAAIDPDGRIRSAARNWLASWSGKPSDLDFSGIVDVLIAAYQSKAPPETMVKIAQMLSQTPRARVTRFMRAAQHAPNPEIQEIAARYLSIWGGATGPPSAPKSSKPRTTEQKIAFLEKLGSPRNDDDNSNAVRYLADSDERVRVKAATALGRIDAVSMNGRDEPGPGLDEAISALINALKDSSGTVRATAAQALGDIRATESADALVGSLDDDDGSVQLAAARALEQLPTDNAVSGLSRIYKNTKSSAELKEQAVTTLGAICNPEALPILLQELEAKSVNPPDTLGFGLSCVLQKKADASAFGPIRKAIDAERPRPQPSLIVALGETKSPSALPILTDLLQSTNSAVRQAAASGLGSLGDVRAVGALASVLKAPEPAQRIYAAKALSQLSDFTAPAELLAILSDADPTVRGWGSTALARSHDPKAIAVLISALSNEPLAISALGESKSRQAVVALLALLGNPSNKSTDRASAAAALGQLGDAQAVDGLIASLKEDNFTITQYASSALAQLKDKRAIEPLKQAYVRWSSGQQQYAVSVKGSINMALVQLGAEPMRTATGSPN